MALSSASVGTLLKNNNQAQLADVHVSANQHRFAILPIFTNPVKCFWGDLGPNHFTESPILSQSE